MGVSMADPLMPTNAVVGVTIGGVSMALGADGLLVLAAIFGALLAAGQSGRLEWTFRSVLVGLASFGASVVLGIAGGITLGAAALALALKLGMALPREHVNALFALFVALYGVGVILPALAKRLGVEIETRGVGQ